MNLHQKKRLLNKLARIQHELEHDATRLKTISERRVRDQILDAVAHLSCARGYLSTRIEWSSNAANEEA